MTIRLWVQTRKDAAWGFDGETIEDAKQAAIKEFQWTWIDERVSFIEDVLYRADEIRGVVLSEEKVNRLKKAHPKFTVWVQGIGDIE